MTPIRDNRSLKERIQRRLSTFPPAAWTLGRSAADRNGTSAVLVLVGPQNGPGGQRDTPCLILNKRSQQVRQPGDLCCPGGGISESVDPFLARLMTLPGMPLHRWPAWPLWQRRRLHGRRLALLLATAIREGWEEMRVNPFGLTFLGPLVPERLVMFRREIFPLVCWISRQTRFRPNWEVERIVAVPLDHLLDSRRYCCYRLETDGGEGLGGRRASTDFPAFLLSGNKHREVLWGATYRITVGFLERVFGFQPPAVDRRPVISGSLGRRYLESRR